MNYLCAMKILKSRAELFILDIRELLMLVKHVVDANNKKRLTTENMHQLISEWIIDN